MSERKTGKSQSQSTLELVFIGVLGVAFAAAFLAALSYDFVSARAPLCILVPLLILVMIQIRRAIKTADLAALRADLANVARRGDPTFNKVAELLIWTGMLLGAIFVAGHYVGIAVFIFLMLYRVSSESKLLSALVSGAVTAIIYLLFEHGFNIELYRGLIFSYLTENYFY